MKMRIYFPGGQRVNATFDKYQVPTDQSIESGGSGTAPDPFSLFLSSIGTCTGIYILRFCQERNIQTTELSLTLTANWNKSNKLVDKINIIIQTGNDFPEKYKKTLLKVAKLCTIKRQLETPPVICIELIK